MNFAHLEHRSVIKFLTKEGSLPSEIYDRMVNVYGNDAPSLSTVKKWAALFKAGRASVQDDPRSGRPVEVVTDEKCDAVRRLVEEDRRIKVFQLAEEVGISVGSVETILHDKLGLSKVCARWVPKMLTTAQMNDRVAASKEIQKMITANPENFFSRTVTGDETWIHHYDPETKQESMQWLPVGSPPPKKFRTQPSSGKVMATVFWDCKGIIMIDYLPRNTTITGAYFANVIHRLRDAIKEKRRGMLAKGVQLLIDNAPVHTAQIAQAAIAECGFTQLRHPPYSPDLAPSDYYLFGNLKKHLRGKRFSSDQEVITATEAFFSEVDKSFFLTGMQALPGRLDKCIANRGSYVEK